jgi:hypothetical protein
MNMPGLTAEASLYKTSRHYSMVSPGFAGTASHSAVVPALLPNPPLMARSLGQVGQAQSFAGKPNVTCGPCTQDENFVTGCSQTCWVGGEPKDFPCHGCVITCAPGDTLCGTTCVNTSTNRNNCGACGHACAANESCQNSQCVCAPPSGLCAGTCTNLLTDPGNCGSCGNACANLWPGQATSCCNGVCKNISSDHGNCGACGNACQPGFVCSGGVCTCPPGQTNCGGTCVNLGTDNSNCGTCGHSCPAGMKCFDGCCTAVYYDNSDQCFHSYGECNNCVGWPMKQNCGWGIRPTGWYCGWITSGSPGGTNCDDLCL